jgi:tRNA A37 threonylcarbamoyladenosine dehydratase
MSFNQERTEILIGPEGVATLARKHVMVVGLGGVGGFAAEALARSGIGRLTVVDHDKVSPSNCNRQLLALQSTIGRAKSEVMRERLLDINPELQLQAEERFVSPDSVAELLEGETPPDFVLDCIDSIACKAALVAACQQKGIAVISALGAGGRLDVSRIQVTTLERTELCPLAREMRKRLRRLEASLDYPVVFSDEEAVKALPHQPLDDDQQGRPRAVNGSSSFMPGIFGLMQAGFVISQLLKTASRD